MYETTYAHEKCEVLLFPFPAASPCFAFPMVLFCPYVDLETQLQTVMRCVVTCTFWGNRRQRFHRNMDPLLLDKTSVIVRADSGFVWYTSYHHVLTFLKLYFPRLHTICPIRISTSKANPLLKL